MKRILVVFICFLPLILSAQKIEITFPQDANKEYSFILNKGIRQDTIQMGNLSSIGTATINIPEKEKDYIGMGALLIQEQPTINIIVNHENFNITRNTDGKLAFDGSLDNAYLYSIIQQQEVPKIDSAAYAPYFVNLIKYVQQLKQINTRGGSLMEKAQVKIYAQNNLDIEYLYTSSLWFYVIDELLKMSTTQEQFGEGMVQMLKRIKSQEVFEALADNLLIITDQYGMDDAFDVIVPYLKKSGRIEVPRGKMFKAFALVKIVKGTVPPSLEGLTPSLIDSDASKTLIVFYQPDCHSCHTQLELLSDNYPKLKEQGVRVISVSGGSDKLEFETDKRTYPWREQLCDFEGFAGPNFLNYGIMGTPTFFLLDKDKKVIKRYALFSDIDFVSVN
ncbi:MAG: TlpA disulfide reductase family protein [Dysgonomonas sp.]|nr:TlpA disulfide reductase family protein [Dysgonomonas sp.]